MKFSASLLSGLFFAAFVAATPVLLACQVKVVGTSSTSVPSGNAATPTGVHDAEKNFVLSSWGEGGYRLAAEEEEGTTAAKPSKPAAEPDGFFWGPWDNGYRRAVEEEEGSTTAKPSKPATEPDGFFWGPWDNGYRREE